MLDVKPLMQHQCRDSPPSAYSTCLLFGLLLRRKAVVNLRS